MTLMRLMRGIAVFFLLPALACAQGVLEVPAQSSFQSGIGLISGWHCNAQRIEISIDLGPPILVSSHTPRDDTAPVCGRSDTGFAMTFNWNILKDAVKPCCDFLPFTLHRVIAFADGVPFGDVSFQAKNLGAEYLTGKSGIYYLRNFPDPGKATTIAWDEGKQNFSIRAAEGYWDGVENGGSGTYYGALTVQGLNVCTFTRGPEQTRYGKFIVATQSGQLRLRAEFADGEVCELPATPLSQARPLFDGTVSARYGAAEVAACSAFVDGGLDVEVNGTLIRARSAFRTCNPLTVTGAAARH